MSRAADDSREIDLLIGALPDAVAVFDEQRCLRACNGLFADMFDMDRTALAEGMPTPDLITHLASALRVGDESPALQALETAWRAPHALIERWQPGDGRVIEVTVTPLAGGDRLAIHRDVTDLVSAERQRERQLRAMAAILEDLDEGAAVIDGDGRVLAFGRRFCTHLGATPDALAIGDSYRKLAGRFTDLEGLSGTQRAVEETRRMRLFSDDRLTCRLHSFPDGRLIDVRKKAVGEDWFVLRLTDVTEIAMAWRGISEERERFNELRQRRAASVAQMNHELRAPLNGILGMAALMRQRGLDSTQSRFLEVIYQSGEFLLQIIDDNLSISQIDSGNVRLSEERISLAELVNGTVDLVRLQAEEKGIALRVTGTEALLPDVVGDGRRLRQCLLNLLGNAIRFTDEGEVTVALQVRAQSGQAEITLTVVDTGIGIAPEKQAAVFEQFYQVESERVRRGGTGLGLAIVKGLLDVMGGEIMVDSEPGQGSAFTISLTLPIPGSKTGFQTSRPALRASWPAS
ncbi:MAG: ATP-binding protein [Pseudomonadota bacterium]